jgi:hypothetical protein
VSGVFSLIAIGTPASDRLPSPGWSSTISASAAASAARTSRNARTIGSATRMWSRWSASTAVADASPRRTARAICRASAPTSPVSMLPLLRVA